MEAKKRADQGRNRTSAVMTSQPGISPLICASGEGFEPPTSWSRARRSTGLNYPEKGGPTEIRTQTVWLEARNA